jgi:hypothetical protein
VWLQEFPLVVCQISSSHATSVPASWFCKQALAQGKTNREISRELLISLSTVKTHVHRIIAKLGVSDRTQAAVRVVQLGLLSEPKE